MSLRVTVVDEASGQTEVQRVPDGGYLLVVVPPCRLARGSRVDTSASLQIADYLPQPLPPDPRRIQRRRTKGWRMPPDAIYVGRPSRWGNQVRIDDRTGTQRLTREYAVKRFRERALERLEEDPDWLEPLRGMRLADWCPPEMPCHIDVIFELLDRG